MVTRAAGRRRGAARGTTTSRMLQATRCQHPHLGQRRTDASAHHLHPPCPQSCGTHCPHNVCGCVLHACGDGLPLKGHAVIVAVFTQGLGANGTNVHADVKRAHGHTPTCPVRTTSAAATVVVCFIAAIVAMVATVNTLSPMSPTLHHQPVTLTAPLPTVNAPTVNRNRRHTVHTVIRNRRHTVPTVNRNRRHIVHTVNPNRRHTVCSTATRSQPNLTDKKHRHPALPTKAVYSQFELHYVAPSHKYLRSWSPACRMIVSVSSCFLVLCVEMPVCLRLSGWQRPGSQSYHLVD